MSRDELISTTVQGGGSHIADGAGAGRVEVLDVYEDAAVATVNRSTRCLLAFAAYCAVAIATVAHAQETESTASNAISIADLEGLWEGRLRLGPDVKGPLVIFRDKDGWTAEINGHVAAGRPEDAMLVFEFGDLVGRLEVEKPTRAGAMGWWRQPFDVPMGRNVTPYAFATPIELISAGRNHWRTEIKPYEFQMTLYMSIGEASDGSAPIFAQNPERNFGIGLNGWRAKLEGDSFTLFRPDVEWEFSGRYHSGRDILPVSIYSQGGTFDLQRVQDGGPTDFYPRGFPTGDYKYKPPRAFSDGWTVSTLADEGVSEAEIDQFIQMIINLPQDSEHRQNIHAVLIARHGRLILEEYFHGHHRNSLHDTRSAAKSFTATLAGAVVEKDLGGFNADTPVYETLRYGEIPDDLDPRKRAMTAEHLLTMSSGVYCDDSDPDAPASEDVVFTSSEQDWYGAMLDAPMESDPGSHAVYCSLGANLLGGVIAAKTGKSLTDLFRDLVARPLGMTHYALVLQPTGEVYMGGGIFVEPRDFLKFAQLMLNKGTWNGHRILSEEWVERASSPLTESSPISSALSEFRYGYLWWIFDAPHRGRTTRMVMATGNGGQTAIAVPELDLAFVIMAGNYSDWATYGALQNEYVTQYVLPAIE